LISAALVVSAIMIFVGQPSKKLPFNYLPFAAILISLGLLSHTGVLFTLVPFALLFLYKLTQIKKIDLKYIIISILLGLAILMPWQIYKNSLTDFDRLVKYHFAGITAYEDKRGTLKTIVDEYRATDFDQWKHRKIQNTKTLITGNYNLRKACDLKISTLFEECNFAQWRAVTFFSTFFALELFALGFVVLIYRLLRRQLDRLDKDIIFIVVGSLIFWIFSMFVSGGTIVHQGSYATMLLLFILLGRHLSKLPYPALGSIVGLQLLVFYFVWVSSFY
ncbi:MAG TPA: hypothetical protein VD947_00610, partial [Patescibacteria group bacterium]|nr:hypothetical protein [Patescibacteria group bacterium]